ncbi:hypothetical protein EMMF5_006305 [Cystobasidiomycetes sp. EMM_F5]
MATRNEFIVKNGLSKREAAQSSGDVDWCTSQDGVSAGCIVLCGVAVVFVLSVGSYVTATIYRQYFVVSPLGNANINGNTAITLEDWNNLPQDVQQYILNNSQDPSLKTNIAAANAAGLIADDPTTAEATLRTYLSYWNSNGGTAVETAADTNKQAVDYKVLDAATQAQLQTDYPNTLQIQNGWAQFDITQAAQTAGLQPYAGTDNQIQQTNYNTVNTAIESQVDTIIQQLADNYNAQFGTAVKIGSDGQVVQQAAQVPDFIQNMFDSSNTVVRSSLCASRFQPLLKHAVYSSGSTTSRTP